MKRSFEHCSQVTSKVEQRSQQSSTTAKNIKIAEAKAIAILASQANNSTKQEEE